MILGGIGALLAAFLLWKGYALPKINKWILEEGSTKMRAWITNVIEHPDGEDGQQIGRLSGVAFAYIMQGIMNDLSTKEGRERWTPIFEAAQTHIQQSIFATFGHLLQKYSDSGDQSGLPQALDLPPFVAGIASKLMPGVDPKQLLQMLSWLSRLQGGSTGGLTSLLPSGSPSGDRRGGQV